MDARDPSISEILASMGYGHRKAKDGHYAREIFRVASGEVVGWFGAGEAIEAARVHAEARADG